MSLERGHIADTKIIDRLIDGRDEGGLRPFNACVC